MDVHGVDKATYTTGVHHPVVKSLCFRAFPRLSQPAVLRRGAGHFGRERQGAERRMRGAPGAEAASAQYDAHSLWRPYEI